ncbi:esterase, putative [Perkinsus marinus ATCC 50983]|uniref:Esterase, putative n=1 Tax=Perkinsus marinus (strain ATCC 50983 / TXsc) TaxID=423536 RepID=C5LKI9_PERM5|nr:esterase, putative [Perkinsus marinus ATCC 50983]EER02756.1 esterase, putative [Perkinsus marinus ATCC 50983]|eukprot:XP_002770940.1 esterase, putative [Perkinsus marinus ATCC 50983]
MRSAGKNAPRHDLRAVRAIANTTIPNVLLPSGVFRCKQYIAFQERDSDNRLHQPVKIDWIWPKRVTPERDQSSHVLKDCPTKEELQRNTVILYVHGGGFCLCSTGTHRHLLYTLALKTENCILCCVNYRQPPESTLIESTSDVECMYRYLISNMGVSPERIAIAGDSAGGDMVVLALVQLRDKRIPLPGCACLLSPWVDLTDKVDYFEQTPQQTPRKLPGSESVTSRGRRKSSGGRRRRSSNEGVSSYACVDYIPADLVVEFAQLAIGDISADDPRISAMYADLRGLPHMLIHAGQAELLLPQIERFAAKFSAQKSESVELQYREFEDMVHVFQLFSFCCGPDEAPNRSLSDIADFVSAYG